MTTSMDLLHLVRDALIAAGTDAGARIYAPGDWPNQPESFPILKLRLIKEDRVSLGRSGPAEFTSTAHILIAGEVSALAALDDDGASDGEERAWRLKRQVDVAVINSMPLAARIQQVAAMRTQFGFDSAGATHLAGFQSDIALEFYEGPENFADELSDPIADMHLTVTTYPPVAADYDLTAA